MFLYLLPFYALERIRQFCRRNVPVELAELQADDYVLTGRGDDFQGAVQDDASQEEVPGDTTGEVKRLQRAAVR